MQPRRFALAAGEARQRFLAANAHETMWSGNTFSIPYHDGRDAAPIYLGDDTTDEEAFASLPGAITVRVGPHGKSSASYHLADPGEVEMFLAWLVSIRPRA